MTVLEERSSEISALLKAGKSAEALHQFREVLRLDPNNTAARRNIDNIVKNQ